MTLRDTVIQLRISKGLSYGEISQRLGVSKSTLSGWLKDLQLTTEQENRLRNKVRNATVKANRRRKNEKRGWINLSSSVRQQRSERLSKSNSVDAYEKRMDLLDRCRKMLSHAEITLDDTTLAFVGTALYWAEGTKTSGMKFTNSDPQLVKLYVAWLTRVLHVKSSRIVCKISTHADCAASYSEVEQHWRGVVGLDGVDFLRPYIIPKKEGRVSKRKKLVYGMLTVGVRSPQKNLAQFYALAELLGMDAQTRFVEKRSELHLEE